MISVRSCSTPIGTSRGEAFPGESRCRREESPPRWRSRAGRRSETGEIRQLETCQIRLRITSMIGILVGGSQRTDTPLRLLQRIFSQTASERSERAKKPSERSPPSLLLSRWQAPTGCETRRAARPMTHYMFDVHLQ